MKKFLIGFGISFGLSMILWIVIGGILSLIVPLTDAEILSYGILTGILFGFINGICDEEE